MPRPTPPSSAPAPARQPLRALLVAALSLAVAVVSVGAPAVYADDAVATPSMFTLDPLLAPLLDHPVFTSASTAVQVVQVDSGDEVWAHNGDDAIVPASVMKVVTSAAALRHLGPTYRFRTEMLSEAEISEDGVLEGDLYFRGTGDPSLVIEKVWKMFQDLQVEGVVEIDGDLVFDDTWFDREHLIAGWRKKVDMAAGPAYFAPLSALSLNFNTVSIVVAPGPRAGEPARVQLETPAKIIVLESEIETVPRGRRAWTKIEREVDPRTHVVTFELEGQIPLEGEIQRHYRSVGNPIAWTMSAIDRLFRAQGIKLNGRFRLDETPDEAEVLVSHASQPLHELLNHTNKYSSNFMAEHVLKAIGAEVKGDPGTTAKGLSVVEEYLVGLGIPADDFILVNGSGLSRESRLAPSHVNAVMMDMYHHPQVAPEFMASLAVGGVDGTLRRRFSETPGSVRGKTGSLNGVYCLTSYIRAADGHTYAMTFLSNDLKRTRPARALQDAIGEAILGWTGKMPVADE